MAQLLKEHSHAFQNRLNTIVTDSKPVTETVNTVEKAPEANTESPKAEAPKPADVAETSNPATETKPPAEAPAEAPAESSALGGISAAGEPKASVRPKDETVPGEKRDLGSTLASTSAPTETKEQQKPEPSDERDAKKQKTDGEPATASNSTAAPAGTDGGGQKKASRPKKEKIKDAVNKIIPGDGIGSRTRSRTKGV